MKKIFCKIIMALVAITIATGGAQADNDLLGTAQNMLKGRGVEVDLHTSVQWYEDAINRAFFDASGLKEQKSKLNDAFLLVSQSYDGSPHAGVVTTSPAKLLEGCINAMKAVEKENDETVVITCSWFVISAVRKHNSLVQQQNKYPSTAASMDDADTKICWAPSLDFRRYNEIFGHNELRIFLAAFATEEEWAYWGVYNCVKLSINEVRARCESALSDTDTASKVNADPTICQKYVEHLVNAHNARIEYNKSVQDIK